MSSVQSWRNAMHHKDANRDRVWRALACLVALALSGCGKGPDSDGTKEAKPGDAGVAIGGQKAPEPVVTVDDKVREPATVEEAARLLDLRSFPLMEGAELMGRPSLGALSYSAKGEPKQALQFQRQHLTERGWKELPDVRNEKTYSQSNFTRDGFVIWVSVYEMSDKAGWVDVSMSNSGN